MQVVATAAEDAMVKVLIMITGIFRPLELLELFGLFEYGWYSIIYNIHVKPNCASITTLNLTTTILV